MKRVLQAAAIFFACMVTHAQTPRIYSCTDARGRTITADRPIPDCVDREQREMGANGLTQRKLEPNYSPREMAEREDRAREAAVQAALVNDERRRARAMLVRYPNAAAHDRERAGALAEIDAVITGAKKRLLELGEDRKAIDKESERYKKNPGQAPDTLRRRLDINTHGIDVQNRVLAEQEEEKRRIHRRFDEEHARLKAFWVPTDGGSPSPATAILPR